MGARLIRYADDFVVMCQGQVERVLEGTKAVLRDVHATYS